MINKQVNISRYAGSVPEDGQADRQLRDAPAYPKEDALALAEKNALMFWTRGSARDAQKWKLDIEECAQLLTAALTSGQFLNSAWCQQQPHGPWAMCDAYKVTRQEWIENAGKYMPMTYYLKFAISKTGDILLMASNHPEGT